MSNSASNEIQHHLGGLAEAEWLASHGLIEDNLDDYSIEVLSEWAMLGSESYVLDFEVRGLKQYTRLMAKACIKMFASEVVAEWHERRRVISEAGVSVPRLYSTDRATYIEEFIPYDLRTAYKQAGEKMRLALKDEFMDVRKTIGQLGFNALSLHDIRSRGDDIVVIDFGSDLGGSSEPGEYGSRESLASEQEFAKIVGTRSITAY